MKINYAAALIVQNKKILLLRRSLMEADEQGKWTPVNETLELGESPQETAIRGVKEELQVHFSIINRLQDHICDGTTAVFLGSITGKIIPNPQEVSEFAWFSFEETKSITFAYGYEQVIENLFNSGLIA